MRRRDRGVIVNVGSALAYRAIPLQSAYCGAKYALRGFTDSLRCELMNDGSNVRVTMVHLPGLNTPQFTWVRVRGLAERPAAGGAGLPARDLRRRDRLGRDAPAPRDAGSAASTVATILGNKVAPSVADWYLARTNVKGQQSDTPLPAESSRLPVRARSAEDRGPHGPYGDEAKDVSRQWRASKHRRALLGSAAGAVRAGAVVRRCAAGDRARLVAARRDLPDLSALVRRHGRRRGR